MKKLTKAALLAAATAFMLAGVTACFTSVNDAGEDDNKVLSTGQATVKYLQLTNTSNSSGVTPDWKAIVSETSLVTAADLVWILADGLTHSSWDIKVNNNGVTEATLEEQTSGAYTIDSNTSLASVSFTITAVKALKLKTISAITSSGKTPSGITCWIDGTETATGQIYAEGAKAYKLSEASLNDYTVATGKTATIKITCDKDKTATDGAKIDFGQICLIVEADE